MRPFVDIDCVKEIMAGELLGDGCLIMPRKGRNAHFRYSTSKLEYIHFIRNKLKILDFRKIYSWKRISKVTGKTLIFYYTYTRCNSSLTELYLKWYPNGTKVIPSDLKLTPIVCLHWYLGDGTFNKSKKYVQLCTHGFNLTRLNSILFPQFTILGIKPRLFYERGGYRTSFRKDDSIKFLNYIGKCPVKCYQYKWGSKNIY